MKSRPVLPALDTSQRYTPEESAAYLRVSRWTVFNDIKAGRLQSIKEGKRRFIPGSEIARRSRAEHSPIAA
jgi:excisionase family DNA binding protein